MTTSILSTCPHCEATLKFKDREFLGKKARCPSCLEPFVVKQTGTSTADLQVMTDTQQLPGRKLVKRRKAATRPSTKPTPPRTHKTVQPVQKSRPRPTSTSPPAARVPGKTPAARPKVSASPQEYDWLSEDLDTYESEEIVQPSPRNDQPAIPSSRPKKKRKRKRKNSYTQEQSTFASVLLALIGGGVAASIGGVAWIGIAIATGYEFGILAWGIGGLVGFGVLLSSRDHIVGDLTGIIAGIIALLAVTLPKMLLYMLILAAGAGGQVGFGDIFSPLDALWIFLACTTAYKVGSGQAGED